MGANRFRRSRSRWWFLAILLPATLFLSQRSVRDDRYLNPQKTIVPPGEYSVSVVRENGTLDVVVPTDEGNRLARVHLLAVACDQPNVVRETLTELIGSNSVRLRFDRRRLSRNGDSLLAYVFVNELFLNEELCRLGLATETTHPADSGPIVRRIKKAEQEARTARRGVWTDSELNSPTP